MASSLSSNRLFHGTKQLAVNTMGPTREDPNLQIGSPPSAQRVKIFSMPSPHSPSEAEVDGILSNSAPPPLDEVPMPAPPLNSQEKIFGLPIPLSPDLEQGDMPPLPSPSTSEREGIYGMPILLSPVSEQNNIGECVPEPEELEESGKYFPRALVQFQHAVN
jgi:hypothetical protein